MMKRNRDQNGFVKGRKSLSDPREKAPRDAQRVATVGIFDGEDQIRTHLVIGKGRAEGVQSILADQSRGEAPLPRAREA